MSLVLDVRHDSLEKSLNEQSGVKGGYPLGDDVADDSHVDDDSDVDEYVDDGLDYSSDEDLSLEQLKEKKRKLYEWGRSCRGLKGLVDTTGALFLDFEDHCPIQPIKIIPGLIEMMTMCRSKTSLGLFTHPGDSNDGGVCAVEFSRLTRQYELDLYTGVALDATQHYNRKANQHSKLALGSVTRFAELYGYAHLLYIFITFIALHNGQIGTYQAAVAHYDVSYLILLRHLDADRILAYMAIPWVPEKRKMDN